MNLLVDTQVFLWALSDESRLSYAAAAAILTGDNDRYLSDATCWELAIKLGLGKLRLPGALPEVISRQSALLRLRALPIVRAHVFEVQHLPPHHRDPFDRLLVAQARLEGMTIVSNDRQIARYDVPVVW